MAQSATGLQLFARITSENQCCHPIGPARSIGGQRLIGTEEVGLDGQGTVGRHDMFSADREAVATHKDMLYAAVSFILHRITSYNVCYTKLLR